MADFCAPGFRVASQAFAPLRRNAALRCHGKVG
jgi:hypothetical protein